ncbi:hypothetical protein ACH5AO_25270 [Streptomyces sp. NPDC018964]|uniref:hypothetical protein n=1 Tax=Streptomyces sp. NPDC018964 TaxID=3365058 RepID=UPI0037B39F73
MRKRHGIPAPASLAGLRHPENPDFNMPAAFYDGDATNPETASAVSRLVPQSLRSDFETVRHAGRRSVPNGYVIPDEDVSMAARMAARADTVYRCPGHHASFCSHPGDFAEILLRIAEGTTRRS